MTRRASVLATIAAGLSAAFAPRRLRAGCDDGRSRTWVVRRAWPIDRDPGILRGKRYTGREARLVAEALNAQSASRYHADRAGSG